jgi:hypothetical protein
MIGNVKNVGRLILKSSGCEEFSLLGGNFEVPLKVIQKLPNKSSPPCSDLKSETNKGQSRDWLQAEAGR